jgi:hypothetical protein
VEIKPVEIKPALMRAKMRVKTVLGSETSPMQQVVMNPVCGSYPFGPNGESEDNSFARWTPSGEVQLTITNPDLIGKLKPGQEFYVDFISAN